MLSRVVTTRPIAAALSTALRRSNRRPARSLSGRLNQPIATTAAPTGRCIAYSHGQSATARTKPPSVGPTVAAAATTRAFTPIAAPNRSFGTM